MNRQQGQLRTEYFILDHLRKSCAEARSEAQARIIVLMLTVQVSSAAGAATEAGGGALPAPGRP